ncbi:hypothetical protein CHELA1G11_12122 [Hyphomicrobiales bacterium]|nr:hypothetical protein CHELA1G11_12122 [Hyphomicrobiales bacterium]CAH1663149.1 hypothetical protein CHELA1G2_12191 [Hyphomicrobiales bacterium]
MLAFPMQKRTRTLSSVVHCEEEELVCKFGAMVIAGCFISAVYSGGALAGPLPPAELIVPQTGVELAQWGRPPPPRHVRPAPRRCWWENRRMRDHRGRWVVRRVQVCTR